MLAGAVTWLMAAAVLLRPATSAMRAKRGLVLPASHASYKRSAAGTETGIFYTTLVKVMSRIDDVDVLEGPLRSMLFDVVHAVCSEFMNEVLCACVSAPHADVKTLPSIIQCAVTTVQQWTPVQRDAGTQGNSHPTRPAPGTNKRVRGVSIAA